MLSLDVGCGSKPKGDINIDFFHGGFNWQTGYNQREGVMDAKKIRNFVLADASHLPLKDGCFDLVISNHTVEHVKDPVLMIQELYRVCRCRVIVRCPHRRGSGAKRPFHLNYLDECWFRNVLSKLNTKSYSFNVTCLDYPLTNRVNLPEWFKETFVWRVIRHVEWLSQKLYSFPLELEVQIYK